MGVLKGSQKAYADHIGSSRAFVTQLKREGKLVLTDDALVDFEATDRVREASSDPNRESVRERWREDRARKAASRAGDNLGGGRIDGGRIDGGRIDGGQIDGGQIDGGRIDGDALDDDTLDDDEAPGAPATNPLYEQRLRTQIRLLHLDEQTKQLELAEKAGRLVRASVVQEKMHDYGRHIRDVLLAIPARVQADLAAESDPAAVGLRLADEIKAALNELTTGMADQS